VLKSAFRMRCFLTVQGGAVYWLPSKTTAKSFEIYTGTFIYDKKPKNKTHLNGKYKVKRPHLYNISSKELL